MLTAILLRAFRQLHQWLLLCCRYIFFVLKYVASQWFIGSVSLSSVPLSYRIDLIVTMIIWSLSVAILSQVAYSQFL